MSDEDDVYGEFEGSSGEANPYDVEMETREILIGFGTDFHDWERFKREFPEECSIPFEVTDEDAIEFDHPDQGIRYIIRSTESKQEFRDAIETEGLIVIYAGHSRYGRGCCFAQVDGGSDTGGAEPGEYWESGSSHDDGLLRWAYPYVSVHLSDIETHQYTFRPVTAAEACPPRDQRHPEAAAAPVAIELPEDLRGYVAPYYEADDHRYWGYRSPEPSILLQAGWTGTEADPFDLGAVNIRCRCFCHFGCSSRLHFRPILRGDDYKAWQRDDSGDTNFAYFTTAPAPPAPAAMMWLGAMTKSTKTKAGEPWKPGLAETLNLANRRVRQARAAHPAQFPFNYF